MFLARALTQSTWSRDERIIHETPMHCGTSKGEATRDEKLRAYPEAIVFWIQSSKGIKILIVYVSIYESCYNEVHRKAISKQEKVLQFSDLFIFTGAYYIGKSKVYCRTSKQDDVKTLYASIYFF